MAAEPPYRFRRPSFDQAGEADQIPVADLLPVGNAPAAGERSIDPHAHLYADNVYVDDRTIDSHVKRVRKKFKAVDDRFDMIDTLYGLGYRFKDS